MRGAATTVAVKERSRLTPIVAALAAMGVAGVALSLTLSGDERASPAEGDPVELVREYFLAFRSRDCEAAADLVDTDGRPGEPDRGDVVDACRQAHDTEPSIERTELLSAELIGRNGDHATVRTEIREGDQLVPSEPDDVPLVRIDGVWRLDLGEAAADESLAGGGGGTAGEPAGAPSAGAPAAGGPPTGEPADGAGTGAGAGGAPPGGDRAPGTPATGQPGGPAGPPPSPPPGPATPGATGDRPAP